MAAKVLTLVATDVLRLTANNGEYKLRPLTIEKQEEWLAEVETLLANKDLAVTPALQTEHRREFRVVLQSYADKSTLSEGIQTQFQEALATMAATTQLDLLDELRNLNDPFFAQAKRDDLEVMNKVNAMPEAVILEMVKQKGEADASSK